MHLPRALFFAPLLFAAPAMALTQPDGAPIPSPMGCSGNEPTGLLATMACACTQPGVCNIGAPCPGSATSCDDGQHGTCESTLWHSPNDNSCIPSNHSGLDPSTQATITPETFHPTCSQAFTLISRGTAEFQNVFGWYNATTNGQPPPASDLHVMLQCGDAAGKMVTLNLQTEPSYAGGDVGFFLITPEDHGKSGACAGGDCCPTVARFQGGAGYAYYSQRELNPDTSSTAPYIHLLIMPGTIAPARFYLAWEDTFDTTSADFTDLVAAVDGVECSGAGQACSTGKLGACALGVTVCSQSDQISCQPLVQPKPEVCDGIDNDCNGVVDNGATCPEAGEVCVNGACVRGCGSLENQCASGLTCDATTGQCVEASCIGVSCGPDQVCRGGTCETACAGVVCPYGQTCVNDVCLDLCAAVACAAGEACRDGVCFAGCAACGGITCDAPLSCDAASGQCTDLSCASPCANGTHCAQGACVDGCSGVICPRGGVCADGQCPTTPTGTAPVDGGVLVPPGSSGGASGAGVDGGNGETGASGTSASSCGCAVPGSQGARGERLLLGAFAALAVGARRRRRRG